MSEKRRIFGVDELPSISSDMIDTIVVNAKMHQVELRRNNEPF